MNCRRNWVQFLLRRFSPIVIVLLAGLLSPVQAEDLKTTTLHGRILYHGPIPEPEERIVKQDVKICGKTRKTTPVTVSKDGELQQVVVSVEGVSGRALNIQSPLIIRNDKCRFFPGLSFASVKQPVEIQNLDSILHNTHIRTKTRAFINVVLLPQSKGIKKVIKKPGLLTIACNKHPFMKGAIHVFDHPYYALTDDQGTFTIQNLPPGTHMLSLWHQTLGTIQQTVTLPQKDKSALDIEFSAPE